VADFRSNIYDLLFVCIPGIVITISPFNAIFIEEVFLFLIIGINPGVGVSLPPDFGIGVVGESWGVQKYHYISM